MMELKGKDVLVFGAGISGVSAAQVLHEQDAIVTLADAKEQQQAKAAASLEGLAGKVMLAMGRQDEGLLEGKDLLILSPGISIHHPLVQAAETRGIPVWSEIELAGLLCRAPIIAVTGTNGKTTTTTLLGEMMKTTFSEVVVGGNIGVALSQEVQHVSPTGRVVAEISSFQLEGIHTFHPHIAVMLNLTPDHIDRHGSFAGYGATTEKIFANQTKQDFAVLNQDDEWVRDMASRIHSRAFFFSRQRELDQGAFVSNGKLCLRWNGKEDVVCAIQDMKLFGGHNVENALAACSAAYLAGVSPQNMANVLTSFSGVEHRIEPVGTVNGVTYYNDSKATNPESSIKALEAFSGHIILIAGGRDKNTDLSELMQLVRDRVDQLILIGEAADRFEAAARKLGIQNIFRAPTMEAAVEKAKAEATPPQVVLLSPACASYDMFDNYEQRGRVFKALVLQGPVQA
jgi:UDP-N-acetylmuramoylalanine--D-glutamate ligase